MANTITNPGFDPKDADESITLGFDFASLTSAVSAPVVTVTRHAGKPDAAPEALLSGVPAVAGPRVLQRVTGGVTGTDYLLRCQVDTPDGDRYVLAGVLPVRSA